MFKELSKYYSPKVDFWKNFEMGLFTSWITTEESKQVDTLIISGLENIIDRQWNVASSALMTISHTLDTAQGKLAMYHVTKKPFTTTRKNFIIGMTPYHLYRLQHAFKAVDFLSRFLIIFLENRKWTVDDSNKPFRLDYIPNPELHIERLEATRKYSQKIAYHTKINDLRSGLIATGFIGKLPFYTLKTFSDARSPILNLSVLNPYLMGKQSDIKQAPLENDGFTDKYADKYGYTWRPLTRKEAKERGLLL